LFRQLAEEEERHEDILTISTEFHKIDALPDKVVPDSPFKIRESLDLAEKMKRAIEENELSLQQVLQMALSLEESVAELYFNELMNEKSDDDVISYLQKYYKDEMSHADRIKQYILENES